jgi:molybdopterin-containing oxidoreductase family iron-sulfur binding subunit
MRNSPLWRGLEERAASDAAATDALQVNSALRILNSEFSTDALSRRRFLALMGASLSLAGLSGCAVRPPPGKIVPYVTQPENLVTGKPLFFATAMTLDGLATGILVESHEGRPTKIEGNPQHPASLGATDAFAQASILQLYDPDRSRSITHFGQPRGWSEALAELRTALEKQRRVQGAGLRVLTQVTSSPTLIDQLTGDRPGSLRREFPQAQWYTHSPAHSVSDVWGARLAFGTTLVPIFDFQRAERIVALDADFLGNGGGHVRYARDFADRRRVASGGAAGPMSRLYVAECMLSCTGAAADHRLRLRAGEIERFARALAAELGVGGASSQAALPDSWQQWLGPLARDLQAHRGTSLVLAGDGQPPVVHALAYAMNHALGNVGQTVSFIDPVVAQSDQPLSGLETLIDELEARQVEVLLIVGANPVFTAQADLAFEKRLQNVPLRVHLGLYQDETAARCHWHIPQAHYLESWSDARAYDGTASIVQPLIAPLYGGRSAHEFLSALLEDAAGDGQTIVRDYWRKHWPEVGEPLDDERFEQSWQRALHDGLIPQSRFAPKRELTLRSLETPAASAASGSQPEDDRSALEIIFRPDPTIHDGQFANNAWLQELPKPITKLTWDTAAFVSPATAVRLGLTQAAGINGGEHGQAIVDIVELEYDGRTLRLPAWISPGHADDAVTVHFGYGRTRAGAVGNTGFNVYSLRTSASFWFGQGATLRKTTERYTLACTQMHHSMADPHGVADRRPVRHGTLQQYQKNPDFALQLVSAHDEEFQRTLVPKPGATHEHAATEEAPAQHHPSLSLYPQVDYSPPTPKWGMSIDLTTCTGCSACVVACQAENNIPVVGKAEVIRGREMHWLRIDRYFTGEASEPQAYFQPVPCMHCEKAPCELVCPVAATVHSGDGLNDMVYNRCVGTRYCSNNCPYKVRRFNFLQYTDLANESLKLLRNPDVTVRSRGVMEKCTYCVQRIRTGQIEADLQGRALRDGDILTACQAACPAQAIVFGDMNDPKSEVARHKALPLDYGLLAELNTRPRTTYLAALRNPNPELETR